MTIPEAEQAGDAVFYHGGNLAAARARYPDAPEPWIDLSTGINPVSYPVGHIPDTAWTRLPEGGGIAATGGGGGAGLWRLRTRPAWWPRRAPRR